MNRFSPNNLIASSQISPFITSVMYPLGSKVLLPLNFQRVSVTGQNNIPHRGPLIIAPTHRSRWDGLVVGHCLGRTKTGRDLRYMVSSNEMKGVQGWLIRKLGGFAINPDAPSVSVLRHGVELLVRNQSLVIFGEGDIFHDRTVQHIKPGLARIALQAQRLLDRSSPPGLPIKIVPVGLYYSDPCSQRGSSVEVRIGQPIVVSDYLQIPGKKAAKTLTLDLKVSLNHLMQAQAEISIDNISAQAL